MINPVLHICICCCVKAFQFHIGMINPLKIGGFNMAEIAFQFHIGMINPPPTVFASPVILTFQFHIGMINPRN